jgi:hypothetical protein
MTYSEKFKQKIRSKFMFLAVFRRTKVVLNKYMPNLFLRLKFSQTKTLQPTMGTSHTNSDQGRHDLI